MKTAPAKKCGSKQRIMRVANHTTGSLMGAGLLFLMGFLRNTLPVGGWIFVSLMGFLRVVNRTSGALGVPD